MTVEELRVEATKLAPGERTQLAHSLLLDGQLERWDHARMQSEIQVGIKQMASGAAQTFHSDEDLRAYFDEVKARGRARLARRVDDSGS